MEFTLQFNMDNTAFDEDPETQINVTLSEIVTQIDKGKTYGKVKDSNGNTIGKWEIRTD